MLLRVLSTEPHLVAFSGVTWFQYWVKFCGMLSRVTLPRNFDLPAAICAPAGAARKAAARNVQAMESSRPRAAVRTSMCPPRRLMTRRAPTIRRVLAVSQLREMRGIPGTHESRAHHHRDRHRARGAVLEAARRPAILQAARGHRDPPARDESIFPDHDDDRDQPRGVAAALAVPPLRVVWSPVAGQEFPEQLGGGSVGGVSWEHAWPAIRVMRA